MTRPKCRKRSLSLGRRMLCDYMHFSRQTHSAAAERLMCIPDVLAARQEASPRPSWGAIMTKAFALAARNHPEMRQAFFRFPWGHIGEYDSQTACVAVDRQVGDEVVMLLAPLVGPENQTLQALDGHLRHYRDEAVKSIGPFRFALRIGRLPQFLRRLIWWLGLHVFPHRRIRHFGTFGVTTMSPYGAKTLEVPTLWSAFLHYGAIAESGEVPVGLVFDHRVMDGAVVGYTLLEMEQALHHDIVAELRTMRAARAA